MKDVKVKSRHISKSAAHNAATKFRREQQAINKAERHRSSGWRFVEFRVRPTGRRLFRWAVIEE